MTLEPTMNEWFLSREIQADYSWVYHEDGDWVQVYSDSKLLYEGHSVPDWVIHSLLESLGFEVESLTYREHIKELK